MFLFSGISFVLAVYFTPMAVIAWLRGLGRDLSERDRMYRTRLTIAAIAFCAAAYPFLETVFKKSN